MTNASSKLYLRICEIAEQKNPENDRRLELWAAHCVAVVIPIYENANPLNGIYMIVPRLIMLDICKALGKFRLERNWRTALSASNASALAIESPDVVVDVDQTLSIMGAKDLTLATDFLPNSKVPSRACMAVFLAAAGFAWSKADIPFIDGNYHRNFFSHTEHQAALLEGWMSGHELGVQTIIDAMGMPKSAA